MKHYIVLDLEMCRTPSGYSLERFPKNRETIQIGAVLMDEEYNIIDSFDSYVKPEFGMIDGFILSLTGISQREVKNAPILSKVIETFSDWVPDGEVEVVSWSTTDRKQLFDEMKLKKITNAKLERLYDNWIDSQKLYGEKTQNDKPCSLKDALTVCDISTIGNAHNGYCDAYNTALLFKKLMTEPVLQLNELYTEAKQDNIKHLSYSLGDLFSGLCLAQ